MSFIPEKIFGNMGNVCHVAKYQNSQHPLNDLWPIRQIELKILKKKCLRITMSMLTNLTCLSTPAKSTPSIEWELFQANELSFSQGLVPFIKVKSTNSKQEILIYQTSKYNWRWRLYTDIPRILQIVSISNFIAVNSSLGSLC